LNPLQGSSNSTGLVAIAGGASQNAKLRPASAKTGLEQHLGGPAPNPYALNGGGVWPVGGNVEQQQYSYQHMPQFAHQQ
jgi:hypothetical protein